jgi:hypothetical protein
MLTKTNFRIFLKIITIAVILMMMFSQFGSRVVNASTNAANPLNTTPDPTLEVFPEDDVVAGNNWPENTTATITFHDPGKPEGTQDYTTSVVVGSTGWNPDKKYLYTNLGGNYDIQPGCTVSVSAGGYYKTLLVANLSVATIDIPGNKITGTTDPGDNLNLWIDVFNSSFAGMSVPVDLFGHWEADFDSEYTLQLGDGFRIFRYDGYGDATVVDWRLPTVEVFPEDDVVAGSDWPINTTATITIHDPDAPQGTLDYTTSQAVGSTSWTFNKKYVYVNLGSIYDIHPGCVVSVSAGGFTKTLTVANLKVTNIDLANSTISGTTDPGVNLWIGVFNSSFAGMSIAVDPYGGWTADFAGHGYTLKPADAGRLSQKDDDGDATDVDWSLPNFRAYPDDNVVEGNGWPENATATITFHDPAAPEGTQDYTTSVPVGPTPWNPNRKYLYTNLGGSYDIRPGCQVSVSAGGFTKTLTVSNLKVTDFDLLYNLVSGTTDPNTNLQIGIFNTGAKIEITSDNQGKWTANFSGIYILKPGDGGRVLQNDGDGDGTVVDWSVPLSIPYVSNEIGAEGGTLATTNGMASLDVPSGAIEAPTDFSITTGDSNYEVDVSQGALLVVNSYSIQPHGTVFNSPATLTFRWDDANNDGIVDGTTLLEANLVLIKDGVVVTPACGANSPACNMTTNTLTVQVSSLSVFELAAPLDSDGDGLPDNVDACPTQNPHGLDADHDGCTDTAAGLRNLVAGAPASGIAINTRTSLLAKVDAAISSLARGNKKAANGQLQLFISEVQAQRGKKIATQTADLLIAYTRNVIAGIP